MEDLYRVNHAILSQNRGYGILRSYQGSVIRALTSAFPEYPWIVWKFHKTPHKFWLHLDNQRKFLDWFASSKNFTSLDDFYGVTTQDIIHSGGRGLLNQHRNSLSQCLQAVYPHHLWKAWKFPKCPTHYWKDVSKVAQCMSEVADKLEISCLEDWYRVSVRQVIHIAKAGSLVQYYKGIHPVLKLLYPSYPWDTQRFHRATKKSAQRYLLLQLKALFPQHDVKENFRHPSLTWLGGLPVELDVYIPSLNLGFEYQGEHHYHDVHYFGVHQHIRQKDSEKKALCKQHGVTLVDVPYWWDHTQTSLLEMIAHTRPELAQSLS